MRTLDVARTSARAEIRRRLPWMIFAVFAGIVMVAVGRTFEEALSRRFELALFIPMVVYLSDVIGTETLALFVRALAQRRVSAHRIFWREVRVGIALGLAAALPLALIGYLWLGDVKFALTLAFAMTANGVVAVLTGMLIPIAFARIGRDPAVGTEELTTALSDAVSILIYLAVATIILF